MQHARTHYVRDYYAGNSQVPTCSVGILHACGLPDDVILALVRLGAHRVADWARHGKRVTACHSLLSSAGYAMETVFDAAHGFRYAAACYPTGNASKRRCARACASGMLNTNPEFSAWR